MPDSRSTLRAYAFLVVTMFLWSTNFVVGRAVHDLITPVSLAFGRWAVAIACLAPFFLPRLRAAMPRLREQWKTLLVLGVFGIGLTNTLIYLAVRTTTATNAVILNSATPILVLLSGAIYFRHRLSGWQMAGMVLALAGALNIVLRGDWTALAAFRFGFGDLMILAGGVCWAVYTQALRVLRPGLQPFVLMGVMLVTGELVLLPLFLMEAGPQTLVALANPRVLASLLYLGVFPSVVAFMLYNRAIAVVGPQRAAGFLYLMPAFGALLSIVVLGEDMHVFHAVGLSAILGGILTGTLRGRPSLAPVRAWLLAASGVSRA